MTVGMLASIIVALILLQLAVVALVGIFRRKRQYRSMETDPTKPQALSTSREPAVSGTNGQRAQMAAWTGFR